MKVSYQRTRRIYFKKALAFFLTIYRSRNVIVFYSSIGPKFCVLLIGTRYRVCC